MASTVESMLTTTPRRSPRDGALPTPTTSRPPPAVGAPITAQILVVPTSRPTTRSGALDLLIGAGAPGPARAEGGLVEVPVASSSTLPQYDLVAEAEVDAVDV